MKLRQSRDNLMKYILTRTKANGVYYLTEFRERNETKRPTWSVKDGLWRLPMDYGIYESEDLIATINAEDPKAAYRKAKVIIAMTG